MKRENLIKAYRFERPDRIPIRMSFSQSCYEYYGLDFLENEMGKHKILFPDFEKGKIDIDNMEYNPWQKKGIEYLDSWGSTWVTSENGITGAVTKHALEDWNDFKSYSPPDANYHNGWGEILWNDIENDMREAKVNGLATKAYLRHGYMFLTLTYVRGFENVMYDMYDEHENLFKLIYMIEEFNMSLVKKYLMFKPDIFVYPEDLGTQKNSLLSPELFKKYIKPSYIRLMKPSIEKGCLIYKHSDGMILNLIDDLLECGVNIINLQDLVNGIDNIERMIKGRAAIDLDIDRQQVTVNGSRKDIDDLIKESVMKLGDKKGGLSLAFNLYPNTPHSNVVSVMDAMEKYSFYYT